MSNEAETPEEKRRTLNQRTLQKLNDPELINDIIAHVSNGGSLIELCRMWQVHFHRINSFVYEKHKEKYEAALKASNEYLVQMVRDELRAMATVDLRKAYDEKGALLPAHQWPDELARAIAAVDVVEMAGGLGAQEGAVGHVAMFTKKLKLWDKLKALELLGKNLSMFIERHEVAGKVTLEDLVAGSMKTPAAPAAPEAPHA